MIPLFENHFVKRTAWSLIYFLDYAYFDIQPSLLTFETPSSKCDKLTSSFRGHILNINSYPWTEQLSIFLADLPTWGGHLGPKIHPGGGYFGPWFFITWNTAEVNCCLSLTQDSQIWVRLVSQSNFIEKNPTWDTFQVFFFFRSRLRIFCV